MANILTRLRNAITGRNPEAESARRQRDMVADRLAHTLRAKVDAAETGPENQRHWAKADSLGPNAAYDELTRTRLRNRCRYEALNNSYAKGLVKQLAYDLIGTGPRPQVVIPGSPENAKLVEKRYVQWARRRRFAHKLRQLKRSSVRDGGGFAVIATNKRDDFPVSMDLRLYEAEQCTTPLSLVMDGRRIVDGIEYDELGNPVLYHFLKYHPGETSLGTFRVEEFDNIPADLVLHYYEQDRFNQLHGIPELTASLPLFANMRRYTLATITAAEVAAMISGVMRTTGTTGAEATAVEDFSLHDLVRGSLLTLPEGHDAHQFKPEQPTTTYPDFKREILNETGRSVNAPLNIVSGNSSGYNFSSGRLDHLPYQRAIAIEREEVRTIVLDPVFAAWAKEAVMEPDYLPGLPDFEEWSWTWNWDGFDSIDPVKDAQADDLRLKNGTLTFKEVFAYYGQDDQEQLDQLELEVKEFKRRGLVHPLDSAAMAAKNAPAQPAEREEDETEAFFSLNGRH